MSEPCIFNSLTLYPLTLNILLSFAQFEREIIGERIRDKKLATARQGKYIGGQPKLGLDIVDRRYVINEKEAKIVRRVFKMLLEMQSCRKITEALNAEGMLTKTYRTNTGKNFGGQRFTEKVVYSILTDHKYVGRIQHKGVLYPAEHNAIVSDELFDKVQAVLKSNHRVAHKHQSKRFALLRRMLRCGECGSLVMPAWTRNHGREYRYYTCSRKVKTGFEKCSLPSLPAGEIEKIVVDQLRGLLRHPDVIARTFREVCASGGDGHDPGVVSRLAELRGRRHQAEQAARSLLGLKDPESSLVQTELKRINGEIKSLDASIRSLEIGGTVQTTELSEVTDALQRLDPVWDVLYPEEQHRILELLIENVQVNKNQVEIRFRSNGIERIVDELKPLVENGNGKQAKPKRNR
ncbi:MAG: recombinase family protein [Pirellulaceae bacterium]